MKRITWIATFLLLAMAAMLVAADAPHFVGAMKGVAGSQKAAGDAIEGGDMAKAKMAAATLENHLKVMAGFFEGRGTDGALEINETAIEAAGKLVAAADAGDKDAAMAALGEVRGTCKSCHSDYRTKNADGSYDFK